LIVAFFFFQSFFLLFFFIFRDKRFCSAPAARGLPSFASFLEGRLSVIFPFFWFWRARSWFFFAQASDAPICSVSSTHSFGSGPFFEDYVGYFVFLQGDVNPLAPPLVPTKVCSGVVPSDLDNLFLQAIAGFFILIPPCCFLQSLSLFFFSDLMLSSPPACRPSLFADVYVG